MLLQVAAALFLIAKVGNWFTSLGLLFTRESFGPTFLQDLLWAGHLEWGLIAHHYHLFSVYRTKEFLQPL